MRHSLRFSAMMTQPPQTRVSGHPKYSLAKWLTAVLTVVLLATSARAADPDEAFLAIHRIITQADLLNSTGQSDAARVKYQQAQAQLLTFKRNFPTWEQRVVAYRLGYLAQRIDTLSGNKPESEAPSTPSTASTTHAKPAPAPAASNGQIKLLEAGAEPRQVLRAK